ncbi:MAG: RNase H-like protein ribonuclease, partial [Candidatus Woesebacteria bacterium GW2011_GWB1_44_11b]
EKVERVVIGVSEGQMARESLDFAKMVEEKLQLVVDVEDETLTSRDAQRLSIEAGIKRKKRRNMEDAYSAALMLQKYLDNLA